MHPKLEAGIFVLQQFLDLHEAHVVPPLKGNILE
jgi:hypothetical protein